MVPGAYIESGVLFHLFWVPLRLNFANCQKNSLKIRLRVAGYDQYKTFISCKKETSPHNLSGSWLRVVWLTKCYYCYYVCWPHNVMGKRHSMFWEDEFRQSKTILLATQCYENQKTGGSLPHHRNSYFYEKTAFLIVQLYNFSNMHQCQIICLLKT